MTKHEFTLLPGEKAYQCYFVNMRWSQDNGDLKTEGLGPAWFEGLPDGRHWNSTGGSMMPREPEPADAIAEQYRELNWPKLLEKYADQHPADLQVTAKPELVAPWCMGWFSHWTWDVGLSDEEVLLSFTRYVDTIQAINRAEGEMVNGYFKEPYCLMGAEDRYRWVGRVDDGAPEAETTDPPCRCSSCRKHGVVRIGH